MKKQETASDGDMKILEEICNLVITMLYDNRLPIEVREEYRKIINERLKIIPLVALDLMEELARKNGVTVEEERA